MAAERCATGVAELDQLLRGGIPKGNLVLVAGAPGTGKTTLGLQFLVEGAKNGEAGVFVCSAVPAEALRRQALGYSFMEPALLKDRRVDLLDPDRPPVRSKKSAASSRPRPLEPGEAMLQAVERRLAKGDVRRVVLDSSTAATQGLGPDGVQDVLRRLRRLLDQAGCTTLLLAETAPGVLEYSRSGVEETLADGILFLSEVERHHELVRTLQPVKMQGTEHSRARFLLDVAQEGIRLAPLLTKFDGA